VRGLRPFLAALKFRLNEPKPRIEIFFPAATSSVIVSKTAASAASELAFVSPVLEAMLEINSDFLKLSTSDFLVADFVLADFVLAALALACNEVVIGTSVINGVCRNDETGVDIAAHAIVKRLMVTEYLMILYNKFLSTYYDEC